MSLKSSTTGNPGLSVLLGPQHGQTRRITRRIVSCQLPSISHRTHSWMIELSLTTSLSHPLVLELM